MDDGVASVSVGRSVLRLETREKLTGAAKYIADLSRPNMLHAAILGSPHVHARILSYDTTAARAVPGVHAVLTGADFPDGRMGAFVKDEPPIAQGKARYIGEPVAVVAADDEAIARRAAQLIEIEYEELPAIATPEDALADGAVLVHEDLANYFMVYDAVRYGNVLSETTLSEGDVKKGFAEADIVVEGEFETPAQAHVAIEPCGALAEIDDAGRVTLWSANQSVFRVQANVCESLKLPMSKLRSLTPRIGGGFGNKMEAHVQPLVVQLAIVTRRPVKLILSREEDFETVRVRHPFKIRMRTGAKKNGTLVARDTEVILDGGAYGDDSPGVLGYSMLMSRGPYAIPHARAHGRLVYTNKIRSGAFRGFGNPQMQFAGETQIDEIAAKLGIDPIEIRLKNALRGEGPWFLGQKLASNGFVECLERLRDDEGWMNRKVATPKPGKKRGFGVAAGAHISGLLGTGAIVRLLEDGTVLLNTGAVDIGQGSDTVLAQICAEALKIPIDRVAVASPDTDGSPYNWGTTASRVTFTTGRSVALAAAEVETQIKSLAADMLECAADDLELRPGGFVGIKGVPDKQLPLFVVSLQAHWRRGGPIIGHHSWVFDRPSVDPKRAVATGMPFRQIGVYSFAAQAVEVEIDNVTGKTDVVKVWSAVDVGRAINPASVEGQMDGGFVQGLGFALTEEVVFDQGRIVNPSLMDYKVPTALDVPHAMKTIIVEAREPDGPFGAKGVGEIGLVPTPAAIANAIADAIAARLRRLPMTPERVLDAMLPPEDADAS
ncbi:MAG: xanthine dehydrogenase family protein molybdopterin-binding subunit [Dongiaceae bacterium]